MHNLFYRANSTSGRWWRSTALFKQRWHFTQSGIGRALCCKAPVDHHFASNINGCRITHVEKSHGCGGTNFSFALALLCQNTAHMNADIAKIDIDRTRCQASMADGAMIGHVIHLFKVSDRNSATRLLFIQKSFDDQTTGKYFIAW